MQSTILMYKTNTPQILLQKVKNEYSQPLTKSGGPQYKKKCVIIVSSVKPPNGGG